MVSIANTVSVKLSSKYEVRKPSLMYHGIHSCGLHPLIYAVAAAPLLVVAVDCVEEGLKGHHAPYNPYILE